MSGLQKLDEQRPNAVRQARDYWNQVVSNTLTPLGQFFLWFLAVGAGIYILYLLTRVAARVISIPPEPSWRRVIRRLAWFWFFLAAATAGVAAYIGVSERRYGWVTGKWWLFFLLAGGAATIIGCLLEAWQLRSGTRVQSSVINSSGSPDEAAGAFLAGRLDALGARPPRGFDMPQGTDVTSLTEVLTLLPGGGMLSALASFLLPRVPVTPWRACVTLINQEQLLVTLHRNGRLVKTILADRASLFFPGSVAAQDPAATSGYLQAIDQCGMLTVAAAIILVTMALADKHSPLQRGLNGATHWESVAGQVLATDQGLSGNEGLSKALLNRAVDVDPDNLAARVARINIDGRRSTDAACRRQFAEDISDIGGMDKLKESGYEALRLRVLYSAAAGWSNVWQDQPDNETWKTASQWTNLLIADLYTLTAGRRLPSKGSARPSQSLAVAMQPAAYILWTALRRPRLCPPRPGYIEYKRMHNSVENWRPTGSSTASVVYGKACLAAALGRYSEALRELKKAIEIDESLRLWARRDPSFNTLRLHCSDEFRPMVEDSPPTLFINVGPLANYAAKLIDIGVYTASDLLDMTSTQAKRHLFAKAVGVPQMVVARWRAIAILGNIPTGPDIGQLDLLINAGVDSPQALQSAVNNGIDELARKLSDEAIDSPADIQVGELRKWAALIARPIQAGPA